MPGRILVVNPNTSPEVTDAYLAAARLQAPNDVKLTGVTGRFGARIVSTPAENLVAGHSALDLVANHAAGYDAVILAISFDTGLDALRSVLPMPVIGITEAALRAAATEDGRIGVVFFGEVSRSLYLDVLSRNRVEPVGVAAVGVDDATDYLSAGAMDQTVLDACNDLHAQGADAIVICGAAIVGMAARLSPQLTVPVFDGLMALDACLDPDAGRAASRSLKPLGTGVGLSPSLTRLLYGNLS
ncbi:MAG: aspartate/glutamate racemase family protein [Pseudomonadota bacterium]